MEGRPLRIREVEKLAGRVQGVWSWDSEAPLKGAARWRERRGARLPGIAELSGSAQPPWLFSFAPEAGRSPWQPPGRVLSSALRLFVPPLVSLPPPV